MYQSFDIFPQDILFHTALSGNISIIDTYAQQMWGEVSTFYGTYLMHEISFQKI